MNRHNGKKQDLDVLISLVGHCMAVLRGITAGYQLHCEIKTEVS